MKSRRVIQALSLLGLNAGAFLQLKWFCPGLMYCHACPASVVSCPIGVIGQFLSLGVVPVLALGILLAISALVGRLLCGWACPFGLLQDLLYRIPSPKFRLPPWTRYVKYALLVVLVFFVASLFGVQTRWFFCKSCPVATASAIIPIAIRDGVVETDPWTLFRFGLLGAVVLASVLSSRAFCKTICPVGALVAPLNEVSAIGVHLNHPACTHCGACIKCCPMQLDPTTLDGAPVSSFETRSECILCNECVSTCPTDALDLAP